MNPRTDLVIASIWVTTATVPVAADTATGPDATTTGKAIFDKTCTACHQTGPTILKTAPDQVTEILQSGMIRAHHFKLTDAQIKDLVEYLTAARK